MSKQTKDAKHFDVDVKVRDFCSKSKLFFIIGFALILISLLSTFTGVDVALEFKGGTIITYSYTGDVDESSISKELTSLVGSTVKVQQGDSLDSDTKTLSLSFTSTEGLTIDRQNEVTNKVKELCPDNEVELLDANDVNARSGGRILRQVHRGSSIRCTDPDRVHCAPVQADQRLVRRCVRCAGTALHTDRHLWLRGSVPV